MLPLRFHLKIEELRHITVKKFIVLFLSAFLCLQLVACDLLTENEAEINNQNPTVSRIIRTADGSTLEVALTQGKDGVFSPVKDRNSSVILNICTSALYWSECADLSDTAVYGSSTSLLKPVSLLPNEGMPNQSTLFEIRDYGQDGRIMGVKAISETGTYVEGAYSFNHEYGLRIAGELVNDSPKSHACIVDLSFRSNSENAQLSLCTGEQFSTVTFTQPLNIHTTTDFSIHDLTITNLLFFDTETFEILGQASTKELITNSSNKYQLSLCALDSDGNEIDGPLRLGELSKGECRRISVIIYFDGHHMTTESLYALDYLELSFDFIFTDN